jgi:(2Fe-2S) ferredoxin
MKLKELCSERYGKRVRINTAGCLGKCSQGVVCVLYPEGKWYLNTKLEQVPEIMNDIAKALGE